LANVASAGYRWAQRLIKLARFATALLLQWPYFRSGLLPHRPFTATACYCNSQSLQRTMDAEFYRDTRALFRTRRQGHF